MDFFKISGKKIKAPKDITVSYENLDKAERTVDGTMVVDIIGEKRKVDCNWEYLSKEDMTTLTKAIKGGVFTEITFHDNETGALVTMTARAEGFTYMPEYNWVKKKVMWTSVAITFKEK